MPSSLRSVLPPVRSVSWRLFAPAVLLIAALLAVQPPTHAQTEGPTTEFEDNGASDWTSLEGEQAFLAAVAEGSDRVAITEIGRSLEDRPIQLVVLGEPAPATVEEALTRPTMYFTCSVHGNEPAGREACLIELRDLAFSDDPATVELLTTSTVLFTPTVNPDGRNANARGNSTGADINRDHLNLRQAESQAVASVIRDWQPDAVLDMHEYGGSPVVYDDDITVLWPRNVNVDDEVYELAFSLVNDHIFPGVEERGFTADEYGLQSLGDVDLTQTAGNGDEGILRNLGGLRNSLGILVESSVLPRLVNPVDPTDVIDQGMSRRVASQSATIEVALEFLDERGAEIMAATAEARDRKAVEGAERSAPMYFDGQRQDTTIDGSGPPPSEEGTVDPPPCGYLLTAEQHAHVRQTLELLEIGWVELDDGTVEVPMGQAAEPLIHLLLDPRGARNHFTGTDATWEGDAEDVPVALDTCTPAVEGERLIRRVEGPSRPATAAAAAEITVVEADTVVIATTADYADALGGTVLARSLDAPLLLSDPARLSAPVEAEITRRGVTDAVLLGGVAALAPAVEDDLVELGVTVRRIAGDNRFETAGLIVDELGGLVGSGSVTVVEGEHADPARGWPDAVGAGVLDRPILLVNGERLPAETAQRLDDVDVTIIGGTAAVSRTVEAEIAAIASSVDRVAGDTRYGTSLAVHEARTLPSSGTGEALPSMWLASGRDWPEALVGAATGSLFLLVDGEDPEGSPETTGWLAANGDAFGTVNLVGTEDELSPTVEASLRELLGG